MPDFEIENSYQGLIAGVDEAGRGPWAGPVVAAAVIMNKDNSPNGIDDSKKLTERQRERLFDYISSHCIIGVGLASVEEIDKHNILGATMLAMVRAVAELSIKPDVAIIDGNQAPKLSCKSIAIIKGDEKSISVAAASVIAKVTRDRIMTKLAKEYPYYGWDSNFGYGTKLHQEGLVKYGITPYHRISYRPIRELLNGNSS